MKHFSVRDLDSAVVVFGDQIGIDNETGLQWNAPWLDEVSADQTALIPHKLLRRWSDLERGCVRAGLLGLHYYIAACLLPLERSLAP